MEQQTARIAFLETALTDYDDGRSKGFYCLAAALLSVAGLKGALTAAKQGEPLRATLTRFAEIEGQELKLRR